MGNTLTNLLPTIYAALDVVSRELVGFIPSVARDTSLERAAKDETVRYTIVPEMTAGDITPAATGPDPSAQTIGSGTLSISKSRSVPFFWEGEEEKGLQNGGTYNTVLRDQFSQAMRTLCNEIEGYLAGLYISASRGWGTAGTTPFATDLEAANQAKKILDDNGAPQEGRSMVIGTTAGVNLRNLTQLTKANEAGSDDTLRRGVLLDLAGFKVRESAGVKTHTKGTATGMDCTAVEPVGETTIAVDGSDSGTILAGDLITNTTDATDDLLYGVASATASGAADGNIVINEPGLRYATEINDELTIQSNYAANMAFSRDAMVLVARAPAMPAGGDAADDRITVQDPVSGLVFDIGLYRQYHRVSFEVGIAYGYAAIKPAHMAIVVG